MVTVSMASLMLARALKLYSPAFSGGLPPKRAANSNRPVWSITPSRRRISAISPVPLRVGITTTLSAASGPGSWIWRWNRVKPIIAPMATTTAKVRSPLIVAMSPPRSRTGRSGGGGAAVGLMASWGERGESRFGSAASSRVIGVDSNVLRLRKNMRILLGLARRADARTGRRPASGWGRGDRSLAGFVAKLPFGAAECPCVPRP